jgi:hypothetical protein
LIRHARSPGQLINLSAGDNKGIIFRKRNKTGVRETPVSSGQEVVVGICDDSSFGVENLNEIVVVVKAVYKVASYDANL